MLKASISRSLRRWTLDRYVYLFSHSLCSQSSVPNLDPQLQDNVLLKKSNKKGLVSLVFENLNNESFVAEKEPVNKIPVYSFYGLRDEIKKEIESATNIDTLLSIGDKSITYQELLKIMSVLAEWSSSKKISASEFQTDKRFISLCERFGSQSKKYFGKDMNIQSDDLSTVASVVSDDEIARLISHMNIAQMTKVMTILMQKKRRSLTLLRALSHNVSRYPETISVKRCADLLYPMVSLNFPDPVLMDRICSDIQENIPFYKHKSSIIGSIATSLGLLKYKNDKLLDGLIEWLANNFDTCRAQDISSMVFTMAILNHSSSITEPSVQKLFGLVQSDFEKPALWLDYIWSLLILGKVTETNVSSVLDEKFIDTLKVNEEIPFTSYKKLLNINGFAKVMLKNYEGPFLPEKMFYPIQISYSKEKMQFTNILHETLKNLLTSDANLKKNCNLNMGFLFDALCVLDSKRNPYPVDINLKEKPTLKRVAMFALDYHDMCKNTFDPSGPICFYRRLLEAQNYKVLFIPYKEFNAKDKLIDRVKYIENKLTEIVKDSNTKSNER